MLASCGHGLGALFGGVRVAPLALGYRGQRRGPPRRLWRGGTRGNAERKRHRSKGLELLELNAECESASQHVIS